MVAPCHLVGPAGVVAEPGSTHVGQRGRGRDGVAELCGSESAQLGKVGLDQIFDALQNSAAFVGRHGAPCRVCGLRCGDSRVDFVGPAHRDGAVDSTGGGSECRSTCASSTELPPPCSHFGGLARGAAGARRPGYSGEVAGPVDDVGDGPRPGTGPAKVLFLQSKLSQKNRCARDAITTWRPVAVVSDNRRR